MVASMMLVACGLEDYKETWEQRRMEKMFQSRKSANRLQKKKEWEKKQNKSKKKFERQKAKQGEKKETRLLQNKESSTPKRCKAKGSFIRCDCGCRIRQ